MSDALVKAIAQEASDVAGQFLNICIRAIDYCPPTDMELGEYLRALITADGDIEKSDKWGFREALMRSFRRRRIFPGSREVHDRGRGPLAACDSRLRIPDLAFRELSFDGEPGQPADAQELERQAHALGRFVTDPRRAACSSSWPPGAKTAEGRHPGIAAIGGVGPGHPARGAGRSHPVRPRRRGHAVLYGARTATLST